MQRRRFRLLGLRRGRKLLSECHAAKMETVPHAGLHCEGAAFCAEAVQTIGSFQGICGKGPPLISTLLKWTITLEKGSDSTVVDEGVAHVMLGLMQLIILSAPAADFGLFSLFASLQASITGHSMGGHGALTIGLKHPDLYQSISAFSPISNPMSVPWGQKAFSGYLGDDKETWKQYDATELVSTHTSPWPCMNNVRRQIPFSCARCMATSTGITEYR